MNFQLINYDPNHTYMEWRGQHTIGENGCRGTRVWMRPSSLLKLDDRNWFTGYFDISDKRYLKFVKNNNKAETNFLTIDPWDIYGDNCNIRGNNISEIIDNLNGEGTCCREISLEELIQEFSIDIKEVNNTYCDDTESIHYVYYSGDYLIIYKRKEIITELQEALDYGTKHNVTFHWIQRIRCGTSSAADEIELRSILSVIFDDWFS